jgi:hypothetical protein
LLHKKALKGCGIVFLKDLSETTRATLGSLLQIFLDQGNKPFQHSCFSTGKFFLFQQLLKNESLFSFTVAHVKDVQNVLPFQGIDGIIVSKNNCCALPRELFALLCLAHRTNWEECKLINRIV